MASGAQIEIDAQYRALREESGFGVRDRVWIAVGGADAAGFLQGQLTNDIEALEPGQGCYAALLDRKGHMQADMRVLRADDGLSLDTDPVAVDALTRHLEMYKIGRDVTLRRDEGAALISVVGPAAGERAIGRPLAPEHAHAAVRVGAVEALAIATDKGIDLRVPGDRLGELVAELEERSEPVGAEALEIIRVESGRPRFGHEMTSATIPQEAGINERAVSFTKGCYIGQETVARLHYKGRPNRHLRGLKLEARVEPGSPVRLGDRELGTVGTAVLSPAFGPIALAVLRREAEPGATVAVGEVAAEVVELPF